jgi:hypothetical protein
MAGPSATHECRRMRSYVHPCIQKPGLITVPFTGMGRFTRRKSGVLVVALAVAALPALAFAGVPLITRSSAYFAETGATRSSVQLHWPLGLVAVLLVVGIVLMLSPRRSMAAQHRVS